MPSPIKTPVREQIEAAVLTALQTSDRPLTARDLYPLCDAADDQHALARVLSHMRQSGTLENGPEVAPGEPGGMLGQGARAVKSYQLPAKAPQAKRAKPTPKLPQAHFRAQEAPVLPVETVLHPEPDDLDSASRSHGGDEFEWTPEIAAAHEALKADTFDLKPEHAGARRYMDRVSCLAEAHALGQHNALADLRCSRCTEGDDDMAEIVSGMDDALLAYADKMLIDDPVWDRLRAVRQAMVEVL